MITYQSGTKHVTKSNTGSNAYVTIIYMSHRKPRRLQKRSQLLSSPPVTIFPKQKKTVSGFFRRKRHHRRRVPEVSVRQQQEEDVTPKVPKRRDRWGAQSLTPWALWGGASILLDFWRGRIADKGLGGGGLKHECANCEPCDDTRTIPDERRVIGGCDERQIGK